MKKQFCLILILLILNSCQNSAPKTEQGAIQSTVGGPQLQQNMQGLKQTVDELMPYVLSPREFSAATNRQIIIEKIRKLELISKGISHSPATSGSDPSFSVLSRGLHEEIMRSQEAMDLGRVEYARGNLLRTTAYCMECHTRTQVGPSFQTAELSKTIANLKPLERGEYLLMTRQFDSALAEFEKLISNHAASNVSVFELDRAVRLALFITVRFQSSADNTLKLIDSVLAGDHLPFYVKVAAKSWKQSALNWKKEKVKNQDYLKRASGFLQLASQLVEQKDDRAGDIEILRAQALLHQFIAGESNPQKLAESYFLLGRAYESVHDLASWSMHEDYYEICIRRSPHSGWSAKCYKRLEESTYLGYTGSAGTSVPQEVQSKLTELKSLAL